MHIGMVPNQPNSFYGRVTILMEGGQKGAGAVMEMGDTDHTSL